MSSSRSPDAPPIAALATELRGQLQPLLARLAGTPPRGVRLTRGIGLDKSLASRLVQACRAGSDAEFLHAVPSPTGLRILCEKAQGQAPAGSLKALGRTIERFEVLLDSLPGGRQGLDAQIGTEAPVAHERREQVARQAAFKATSFLFGHFCDTLVSSLFVSPAADGRCIDVLEIHRRIGLQRVVPGTPLPLLSVQLLNAEAGAGTGTPRIADIDGHSEARGATQFIIDGGERLALQLVHEGLLTTFVIGADTATLPPRLSTALRVYGAAPREPGAPYRTLRNYMLHTPCRTVVREVFVAGGLWPDAQAELGHYLPGPSGTPALQIDPALPSLRRVNLVARIEQLPAGESGWALAGLPDHAALLARALQRAGLPATGWRGWRSRMPYPVPLIETQVGFRFAAAGVPPSAPG
ncbi:hypothetical protein [Aquabacterium sp.]|uniref:hypothetical protein n=1 Tax=Aquabacterium sp. TaxID=1872578 RepID=UPI0037836FB2